MKVKTKMNFEKYKKFSKFHTYTVNKLKDYNIIVCIFIIVLFLMYFLFNVNVIYLACFLAIFLLAINIAVFRNVKKHYESCNPKIFEKETVYEFLNNEIVISDDENSSKIKYENLYQFVENSDSFYLYITKMQAYVIFKEDIKKKDYEDLRNLLIKNAPNGKYIYYK